MRTFILSGRQPKDEETANILNEYALCQEFGWTPSQVRAENSNTVAYFLAILQARYEKEKIGNAKKELLNSNF